MGRLPRVCRSHREARAKTVPRGSTWPWLQVIGPWTASSCRLPEIVLERARAGYCALHSVCAEGEAVARCLHQVLVSAWFLKTSMGVCMFTGVCVYV